MLVAKTKGYFLGALAALLLAPGAQAAIIVTAVETGGNVVFSSAGGTLNLSGLTYLSSSSSTSFAHPTSSTFSIGTSGAFADYYSNVAGPGPFGSGPFAFASSGSGDKYGVTTAGNLLLIVPGGYVSNGLLSASSMTFNGQTFASLGMTPGTYVYSWASDTLTLGVGAAVPIPAAVWLFGSALGVMGWMRRKAAG